MGRIDFGYTWWGKKWLDALISTDYSNRLPRGARYARNGSVRKIVIEPTIGVFAHVQGSRAKPYRIDISLPSFSEKEKSTILDIIIDNPFYLSSLLNRKLPQELFDEFQKKNIKLFPTKWKDMSADCSCPDWADCCKHIAAVIYIVANEIDKNPFIVFLLHNLDIFQELAKKGFQGTSRDEEHITALEEERKSKSAETAFQKYEELIEPIDLSRLPHLQEQILALLDDKPLFLPEKNFKLSLAKAYKGLAKYAGKIISDEPVEGKDITRKLTDLVVEIDENLYFSGIKTAEGQHSLGKKYNEDFKLDLIFSLFQDIPLKTINTHTDKVIALYHFVYFVLKLIEKSAFVPEIIKVKDGYRIRWLPALMNKDVNAIFNKLVRITPPGTLMMETKNKPYFAIETEVKNICSLLLNLFIANYVTKVERNSGFDHDIDSVFFKESILKSTAYGQKELPVTIALWLGQFHVQQKDLIPMVQIEENEHDFELSILAEDKRNPLDGNIPINKIFTLKKYADTRMSVLKDLNILAKYFPEINQILVSRGEEKVQITSTQFPAILFSQLPVLKMLGIPLLMPKSLEQILRPQISLKVGKKESAKNASFLSMADMLDFDWTIALGDQTISVEEFKALIRKASGVVKIKDHYVYFDDKDMQKIMNQLESAPRLTAAEKLRAVLSEDYQGARIELEKDVRSLIENLGKTEKMEIPTNLQATLRVYQENGYAWLYKNAAYGLGCLMADDMGLGKTIQMITLLLRLKSENRLSKKPALIVVPTTLITNWLREIEKFGPDLAASVYHGVKRDLIFQNMDVIITTYGLVRSDQDVFSKHSWSAVIIDEAQNIKNVTTEQTKAVKKLKSDIRIAMTGTPVENRLSEYWSIFDFLNKGYLPSLDKFRKEFALPIEVDHDQHKIDIFKKITAPFIIRRLKSDKSIIKDLPDKIENDQFSSLSKEQTALYQNVVDSILKDIEESEGINRKGLIFKLMTSLKQICNHPSHFLKKKTIQADHSGKTDLLLDLLETIYENEEKVLIFTQYTEMGELLKTVIQDKFQTEVLFFHGGLTRKNRDELVDQFQNLPMAKTMILSLKAGGTGLNLTAASNVIHFDLWWNPAVEAQATDRAYRIGQKSNVMVYRLITKGTFEEKINDMIQRKKELANLTVNTGEQWIGELSNQELQDIFQLAN